MITRRQHTSVRHRFILVAKSAAALACVTMLLTACSGPEPEGGAISGGGPFGGSGPATPVVVPPTPDLDTPEDAVRSYLDWTNVAYRMANSEAASPAMSPYEGVRVDSYIELNRQQGNKGIFQRITSLGLRLASTEGTMAVVTSKEEWRYRYFSLASLRWIGPQHTASYDATYTLTLTERGWLVDKVDAAPLGPLE